MSNGPESAGLMVKSLDRPDESRRPSDRGRVELVSLGEATVGRATFEPGWRWADDVKPVAGTDLCQVTHTGYVVSGRQGVRMADGSEVELGPGDAFLIGPGHDSWVIGDEPCVTLDFTGIAGFVAGLSEEDEEESS
jgi:hypothetical protein